MIDFLSENISNATTLEEILRWRAKTQRDQVAYRFVSESAPVATITYGQLETRAQAIAARLRQTMQPGDRALLLYPAGLDFITAFFGCVYAKVLAVPTCYPKPKRPMPRLSAIGRDARASTVLTNSKSLGLVSVSKQNLDWSDVDWCAVDEVPDEQADHWDRSNITADDIVFLQYTSGSTSDPKGVMVTHGNLVHNLEVIREGFQLGFQEPASENMGKGVFWLPAYHDMGLIGGILTSLYVGGESILMCPTDFLRRPIRWLQAITEYGANISGAPNFAYELCAEKTTAEQRAELDLSSWRVGFCGAEPIRPETLERFVEVFEPCGFQPESFYPCYGLAESTLLAAGGDGPARPVFKRCLRTALSRHEVQDANGHGGSDVQALVSCGRPRLSQKIKIVDPEACTECEPDSVGEIWLRGPSVAAGYWNRPLETAETFQARLRDNDETTYLRTGDLGFLSKGELYVTGRVKDVIIIRGRNIYPQDIERSVAQSHPGLRLDAGAAFPLEVDGEEQLGIVHEVDRSFRNDDLADIARSVRRVVIEEHEVDPYAILLIRQVSLPMTTSGKVQRSRCKTLYHEGKLKVLYEWVNEQAIVRKREDRLNVDFPASSVGQLGQPGHSVSVAAQFGGLEQASAANVSGTIQRSGLLTDHGDLVDKPAVGNGTKPAVGNGTGGLDYGDGETQSRPVESSLPEQPTPRPVVPAERAMTADEIDRLTERIEIWLMNWLTRRANVPQNEIHRDKPFADYGLDSLTAVEMSRDIEDWLGVQVTATVAWNYPTCMSMARYLARQVAGVAEDTGAVGQVAQQENANDLEQMLQEIESLSDDEVERLLAEQASNDN